MKNKQEFFKPEDTLPKTVDISVQTDDWANYKLLDSRIISTGPWQETSPMSTYVTVLREHEQDIVNLLKQQPGVQFVNQEITEHGVKAQEEMRRFFEGM